MNNFYSVIIGRELLNGRRRDLHFDFVNHELLKRGWEQKASFVINDNPKFIEDVLNLIKTDKDSVLFCFGGIGATPDDYTRAVAAKVFTNGEMELHPKGLEILYEKFTKDIDKRRLQLVNFPKNSSLLTNIINQVPGFYLENRFFFMPGFPQMSHPMVIEALEKFYPQNIKKHRKSIVIKTSEGSFLELMEEIPKDIDFSSLPCIDNESKEVEISFASTDEKIVLFWIKKFEDESLKRGFEYKII
ncbi:MAG: hypothetical protein QG567_1568 [Campylobacterota bacterium]|nr:hypothetical protein [Campylobacterota bacterium]